MKQVRGWNGEIELTLSNKDLFHLISDLQARQCIHRTITKMIFRNWSINFFLKAEKIINKQSFQVWFLWKSYNPRTGQTSYRNIQCWFNYWTPKKTTGDKQNIVWNIQQIHNYRVKYVHVNLISILSRLIPNGKYILQEFICQTSWQLLILSEFTWNKSEYIYNLQTYFT